MKEPIQITEIIKQELTVGRAPKFPGSDLEVRIDGKPIVTIHYVYPWIDNAGQYNIAEKIVKMFKGEE